MIRPTFLPHRPPARRGLLIAEVLAGLVLIGATFSLLVVALASQRRAAARLSDDRAAVRRAEATLLDLAGPSRTAATTRPTDVAIHTLDGTPAPDGWRWVAVTAASGPRRVAVVGLARAEAGVTP